MDERPWWKVWSGRRAGPIEWLATVAILLILALVAYNALWQRHLDRLEAAAAAAGRRIPPERRPRPYVPDRRFRSPLDRAPNL